MLLRCFLALVAVTHVTSGTNPGVQVQISEKGLEYGGQLVVTQIQQKLATIKVPDISGTQKVAQIGSVQYSLSNMRISNVGLPQSAVDLVPATGARLSIRNAFVSLNGDWRVKYFRIIKDHGSFDLSVNGLTITTSVVARSDETGRPVVSAADCVAAVGSTSIKFHGGASWLYNLFRDVIDKALRNALQRQMCPLVSDAVSDLNLHLKTLNVVAQVDKYAEIDYSMVSAPTVSNTSIDLNLRGEFYTIGKHREPPFSPTAFLLPPPTHHMLYMAVSAFTANSAAFVYNAVGALSLYITDDMIPPSSPLRLDTRTFGAFIPQIGQRFPGLMMKLLVKTATTPITTFEPNNVTVQGAGTVTAYAIQPNTTLSPLFVLNLETSVSGRVFISGTSLAGAVNLNQMVLTLKASYVGAIEVKALDNVLQMVLKVVVVPRLNARLAKGYPLPTIGKTKLVNTELQVLKDHMLIGTDVQFPG